jgi:hypothetical protein
MSECWDAAVADTEFKETTLKIVTTIAHGKVQPLRQKLRDCQEQPKVSLLRDLQ